LQQERLAMKREDVLIVLDQPDNEPINWAIGPLLGQQLEQEGWEAIIILQHLVSASPRLKSWNKLFDRVRHALANPGDLPIKGALLLTNVKTASFNDVLDDFVAELLGVLYLAAQGHNSIRFLPEGGDVTVDLESKCDGNTYYTEVKNLREPRSLSFVAFKRWQRNRTAHPDRFKFRADFVDLDDPLSDLTADQEKAVNTLVDELPDRRIPSTFTWTLPGERRIRVRLSEGTPVMVRQGPGPFLVGPVVEEAQRSLLMKLMDPARKALSQLYRSEVPAESRRLLLVRWKLPEEIAAIGESENVRSVVHQQTQSFLRSFFPNFSLTIMHNTEDPNDAPKATWG
jgi:hypothetical protein